MPGTSELTKQKESGTPMSKSPARSKRATSKSASSSKVSSSKKAKAKRETPASTPRKRAAKAQPGFDLDGWASRGKASSGQKRIGVGRVNRDLDQSLPARPFTGKEQLPRFGGKVTGGKVKRGK